MERRRRRAAPINPSSRTYRVWSPGRIRAAELSAQSGILRDAADLVDWILADDKVQSALEGRVAAMLSTPLTFEPAGDKRRSRRTVRALEAEDDWWAMIPTEEARLLITWRIVLGLGSGVLDWSTQGHGGRDLPVLRFYPPHGINFDSRRAEWRYQPEGAGLAQPIVWGDGTWVGHGISTSNRPWANGRWRGLARWCLLKAYAISDYGRAGETASRNVVEIDKEALSTNPERQRLADDINALGRDGAIVLPPGYHYRTVELAATTAQLYKDQITLADNAIAIAIRGGNLSMDVKGGSRAAAEVQERQGDGANKRSDAEAWIETVHSHILRPWAASNYGDQNLAPWPSYDVDPPEDRTATAAMLSNLMMGAQQAANLGFAIDQKAFADRFGLSDWLKPGKSPKKERPREPLAEDNDDPEPEPEE